MKRAHSFRHNAAGFTLIELMVTVAIVGILAAIAYSSYIKYMVRSNRTAAESYLVDLAQAENQWMADSRTYTTTVSDLKLTAPSAISGKYTVGISATTSPPGYTITATPVPGSSQDGDGNLTIDNTGARGPSDKW
jgi:type IV pilus assembly protein PilE